MLSQVSNSPPTSDATPTQSTIPISIVGNSHLFCKGLNLLLAECLEFCLIDTHIGEPDLVTNLINPQNHIVLLDSGIGLELTIRWIRYWRNCLPPARVLLLEMQPEIGAILMCVEAGANGYTLRNASAARISEMVQLAVQGEAICSTRVIGRLFERVAELKTQTLHAQFLEFALTAREREVLRYIVQGLSNRQIADELVITTRTVKFHVHNILAKMNCNNRSDVAKIVLNSRSDSSIW